MFSIDIDIGGTFTDGFFTDGPNVRTAKVLTTPHDITEGLMSCVEAGSEAFEMGLGDFLRRASVARVSTTVGTNLLVQHAGPRLGLIVTKGQERSLYGKGRAAVLERYVSPDMVAGVREAVDDDGNLAREVGETELLHAVRRLVHDGARMIVISFRNAWRNPHNERRAREFVVDRYPVHYLRSVPMQIGTEVMHVADDHARTNSAVFNAYIHAEMARTLYRGEDKLREAGFQHPLLVVHANGGNARVAKTVALHTLHSGPAVAARGATFMARLLRLDQVVTTDMGGTSLDVSVISNGQEPFNQTPTIDGVVIAMPMIAVESIGAGGGSIASAADGRLRVGPESAGSAPGPVCYAKGGMEPTATDANLLLGFIDAEHFLGGRMRLDTAAARRAMERRIGRALKLSAEDCAFEVRAEINRQMGVEIDRRIGGKPAVTRDFTLFAFGGCGPLHACAVADAAGVGRIIAFPFGSVFSAFGSSTTSVRHTYAKTLGIPMRRMADADAIVDGFRAQADGDMAGEGFLPRDIAMTLEVDLSDGRRSRTLAGTGRRVTVRRVMDKAGARRGTIDGLRLTAECDVAHWSPPREPQRARRAPTARSYRDVRWRREEAIETPIYDRFDMRYGHAVSGPAIVEGPDTGYAVDPGWRLEVDAFGNFVISRNDG